MVTEAFNDFCNFKASPCSKAYMWCQTGLSIKSRVPKHSLGSLLQRHIEDKIHTHAQQNFSL